MPDGSSFKFDIKKDTSQEMRKGVPQGSLADATRLVSNNIVHQKSEVVNTSEENVLLEENIDSLPEISKAALGKKSEKSEAKNEYDYLLEGSSPQLLKAVFRMYDAETAKAKDTAELYKENNKVLTHNF